MNNDLLNQIPSDEQPIASKIHSIVKDVQPSQAFLWELEQQLMDKAIVTQPVQNWLAKMLVPVGWAIVAIGSVFLLNWTIQSLLPRPPLAAEATPTPEVSFEGSIRSGQICRGPLALGHGFAVFLTNPAKTEFVALDARDPVGELRSFYWSADGSQLAVVGNTMGSGNIYLTDPSGSPLQPILANGELGYLRDAAWSRDGKQFVLWSTQNNSVVQFVNADGSGLTVKPLGLQISSPPQFGPDNASIIFRGADSTSGGLFQVMLNGSASKRINPLVEDETGFAMSPDGLHLAYITMDRISGEAILLSQEMETGVIALLGSLPIPKGSGSSIPASGHLNWSADGKFIVFAFGRNAGDSAIYLAHADGTGLVKVVDSAYAPSISGDGKCLAYISANQVFLMDLNKAASSSSTQTTLRLADLPAGKSTPHFKLDRLQWRPTP